MDYGKEIFEKLNLKPDEEFEIKDSSFIYRLTEDLILKFQLESGRWTDARNGLSYLLNGEYVIKKIIKPLKIDQVAIDYVKVCGCNWLAKDKDGFVYAYSQKPKKLKYAWRADNCSNEVQGKITFVEICIPVSFLSWEDDEPYYIGD